MSKSKAPTPDGNEYRYQMTTLKYWHNGEQWKATEPASSADIVGTGETHTQAVADYAIQLENKERDPR